MVLGGYCFEFVSVGKCTVVCLVIEAALLLLGDGYKLSYLLTVLLNKNSSNNNNTVCRENH